PVRCGCGPWTRKKSRNCRGPVVPHFLFGHPIPASSLFLLRGSLRKLMQAAESRRYFVMQFRVGVVHGVRRELSCLLPERLRHCMRFLKKAEGAPLPQFWILHSKSLDTDFLIFLLMANIFFTGPMSGPMMFSSVH